MRLYLQSASKLGLVFSVVISMPMVLINSAPAQAQFQVTNFEFYSQ